MVMMNTGGGGKTRFMSEKTTKKKDLGRVVCLSSSDTGTCVCRYDEGVERRSHLWLGFSSPFELCYMYGKSPAYEKDASLKISGVQR